MSNEELMPILPLQVISNVQTSLNIFVQSEELNEPDAFFCNFCESFQSTSVDHEISKVGSYLVLQLKRFINHLGNFTKDIKKAKWVQCTDILSLPVVLDDVSFPKKFNLAATVNHIGIFISKILE